MILAATAALLPAVLGPIPVAAGYLPGGTYAATCIQTYMDGPFLHAVCRRPDGTWRPTHIFAPHCGGHGIINQNGVLACGA
jgi:hypothetical protein